MWNLHFYPTFLLFVPRTSARCWQPGKNPYWLAAPVVEQVTKQSKKYFVCTKNICRFRWRQCGCRGRVCWRMRRVRTRSKWSSGRSRRPAATRCYPGAGWGPTPPPSPSPAWASTSGTLSRCRHTAEDFWLYLTFLLINGVSIVSSYTSNLWTWIKVWFFFSSNF